jgi:hypothetical protein
MVPARAHLVREPLTLYFADPDAPGEDDTGGIAISSLFAHGDRDKAALAWGRSWVRAARGDRGAVSLVQDDGSDEALESLFDQSTTSSTIPRRAKAKPKKGTAAEAANAGVSPLPSRKLKQIQELGKKTVDVIERDGQAEPKKRGRRGLREETPAGKPIGEARPAPQSAPLAYSEAEKEGLALEVLQLAINGSSTDLRNYRHLRGVGADALDKLRRYFEIKATYGVLPNDITLTANEAERAYTEGDKFFLAVIAGLEQGYETVVRVFPNPLRNLDLKPTTSVTLTGVTARRPALEVRFPADGGPSATLASATAG